MTFACARRFKLGLLTLLLIATSGYIKRTALLNPFQMAGQLFLAFDGSLNYVAPLQILSAHKQDFANEGDDGPYAQAVSTYGSFVGNISVLPISITNSSYCLVPVDAVLVPRARATSVVLINEAHNQPSHRVYCRQLLTQLLPLGYKSFAVEALGSRDSGLNKRKFPLSRSGFYTCEPNMGNLLRAAMELGFTTFRYEVTAAQNKDFLDGRRDSNYRDSMQAVNILAILRQQPKTKLLVLVGYDHIMEQEHNGFKRLATYLRELGGINPLTIDQTLTYPSTEKKNCMVLASQSGGPVTTGYYHNAVDLQVIHPPVSWANGRPSWLAVSKPVIATIPPAFVGHTTLVQLYDQAEYTQYKDTAIPMDQYLTTLAQHRVSLFAFKPGRNVIIKYRRAEHL